MSVLDTETFQLKATIPAGRGPRSIALTPNGKYLYVASCASQAVLVIDTKSHTVIKSIPVPGFPADVAITPDGQRAYAVGPTLGQPHTSSRYSIFVIDTAINQVVATVTPDLYAERVAFKPDGKYAYFRDASVQNNAWTFHLSVLDTATYQVIARVPLGRQTSSPIAAVPPPPGLPFRDFKIAKLDISVSSRIVNFYSYVTLSGTASNGIHPDTETIKLTVGGITTIIPPGAFEKQADGSFIFRGFLNGVQFDAYIRPVGTLRYLVHVLTKSDANLNEIKNPVQATLTIGDDSGLASVNADLFP